MKQFTKTIIFVLLTSLSTFTNATIISASDTGWYSSFATHTPSNVNYIVGYNSESGAEFRNFMVFDLSSVGAVTSAVLRAYMIYEDEEVRGYKSEDVSETWELKEVATSVSELTNFTAADPSGVFDDLGNGNLFGSVSASADDLGSYVEVALNADALTAISNASGLWAIGGSISTLAFSDYQEYVFSWSHDDVRVELVLNELVEVPAPAGLGLVMLFVFLRFFAKK